MQFKYWLDDQEILEVFGTTEIEAFKPLDGKWVPSIETPGDNYGRWKYYFNAPSDPKKDCEGDPCYYLSITTSDSSDGPVVGISFGHAESRYADRWDDNATEEEKKLQKNISSEVMKSILYGIGQFINKKNPASLTWSAVYKSRHGAVNQQARKKVYKLWAIKNLFPDKYVPVSDEYWIRTDVYKKEYENKRRGPSLESAQKRTETRKGAADYIIKSIGYLQRFRNYQSEREYRRQHDEEERRYHQEEEERQRREQESIRQQNTNNFQVGDEVMVDLERYGFSGQHRAKITELYLWSSDELWVVVYLDEPISRYGERIYEVRYSSVTRIPAERRGPRPVERSQEQYADCIRQLNTRNLQPGDMVATLGFDNDVKVVNVFARGITGAPRPGRHAIGAPGRLWVTIELPDRSQEAIPYGDIMRVVSRANEPRTRLDLPLNEPNDADVEDEQERLARERR